MVSMAMQHKKYAVYASTLVVGAIWGTIGFFASDRLNAKHAIVTFDLGCVIEHGMINHADCEVADHGHSSFRDFSKAAAKFQSAPMPRFRGSPGLRNKAASPPLRNKVALSAASKQLSEAEKAESFWAGSWVCADCGYIYDRKLFGNRYFEEQTFGFKCPQCSGPRRRYAKMVGDTVGVTLDGGDGPILLVSGIGFLLTLALGFYISNSDF